MSTRGRGPDTQLLVRRLSDGATTGVLQAGPLRLPCAIGRGGIKVRKSEGDGVTPYGRLRLLKVLYNPVYQRRPMTALPLARIRAEDGWCDAPSDNNYNRFVRHPYPASAERLWRDDGVYDVVGVLDYNVVPRKRGAGSAIFLHVARPGFMPTAGCIALRKHDLLRVLAMLGKRPAFIVTARF